MFFGGMKVLGYGCFGGIVGIDVFIELCWIMIEDVD